MTPAKSDSIADKVLHAFDKLNGGDHPGFRPAHAKGILLTGRFLPAAAASSLTNAPHIQRDSTPVTIRFSDATGIPVIPDTDPNAGPRGLAVRFHLAEHVHTDIIAHSTDGFPVRTADEFVELMRAAAVSGAGVPKPTPLDQFLGSHPAALAYLQAPKPVPAGFFQETYYGVIAYRFLNAAGEAHYGRYRIRPDGPGEYLDAAAVAARSPNFLFDQVAGTLAKGPARMRIVVQVAESGDVVDDATIHWPQERREVDFGVVEVTGVLPQNEAEQRHIIFDPIPRVAGIEPSADPLLEPRAEVYLASGRRRRHGGDPGSH